MALHIQPPNDSISNDFTTTCACGPKVEFVSGEMIVLHDAADGRIQAEQYGQTDPAKRWAIIQEN